MKTISSHFAGTLKRLGGDEDLFCELACYFVEDAPELLHTIHEALTAGSAPGIQRAAHSLRSLVANFDAEQATAIASGLEQMGAKGDLVAVPAALAGLEVEVQSLLETLREYAAQAAPPIRPKTECLSLPRRG
jgi:HPt (histidine-containing phosphotransfer) domain-containing protein